MSTKRPRPLRCAAEQRGQHAGDRRLRAAEQVADLEVRHDELAVAGRDLLEHAGHRDVVDVVAGTVRPDRVLAVAGDRADHQPRVRGMQRVPAEAEALHHAGAKAFDQHVGALHLLQQCRAALGAAQVEPQQLLAAVQLAKDRADPAGGGIGRRDAHVARAVVLPGRRRSFDLQHAGAELGQVAGRERARQQPRQVDHPHAGERQVVDGDRLGVQSKRRSRSHLVATHFSPSTTGAPPCSVRVDGCGRV